MVVRVCVRVSVFIVFVCSCSLCDTANGYYATPSPTGTSFICTRMLALLLCVCMLPIFVYPTMFSLYLQCVSLCLSVIGCNLTICNNRGSCNAQGGCVCPPAFVGVCLSMCVAVCSLCVFSYNVFCVCVCVCRAILSRWRVCIGVLWSDLPTCVCLPVCSFVSFRLFCPVVIV